MGNFCLPESETYESGSRMKKREAKHGDPLMYTREGCRCELCKEAKSAKNASYRTPKPRQPVFREHGAQKYKIEKCRCDVCKEAHAARARAHNTARRTAHQKARKANPLPGRIKGAPSKASTGAMVKGRRTVTPVSYQTVKVGFDPTPVDQCGMPWGTGGYCRRSLPCALHPDEEQ